MFEKKRILVTGSTGFVGRALTQRLVAGGAEVVALGRRGSGIDGEHDGYIHKNMLACYTHQRNTRNNNWVERFVDFVRQNKSTGRKS